MNSLTPDRFSKALADATRARIALLIAREGELCVCELSCALAASQPKISRHLALLRDANLLLDTRRGQWIYYRLHPTLPAWAQACLDQMTQANATWLAPELERLTQMADRPTSCC